MDIHRQTFAIPVPNLNGWTEDALMDIAAAVETGASYVTSYAADLFEPCIIVPLELTIDSEGRTRVAFSLRDSATSRSRENSYEAPSADTHDAKDVPKSTIAGVGEATVTGGSTSVRSSFTIGSFGQHGWSRIGNGRCMCPDCKLKPTKAPARYKRIKDESESEQAWTHPPIDRLIGKPDRFDDHLLKTWSVRKCSEHASFFAKAVRNKRTECVANVGKTFWIEVEEVPGRSVMHPFEHARGGHVACSTVLPVWNHTAKTIDRFGTSSEEADKEWQEASLHELRELIDSMIHSRGPAGKATLPSTSQPISETKGKTTSQASGNGKRRKIKVEEVEDTLTAGVEEANGTPVTEELIKKWLRSDGGFKVAVTIRVKDSAHGSFADTGDMNIVVYDAKTPLDVMWDEKLVAFDEYHARRARAGDARGDLT